VLYFFSLKTFKKENSDIISEKRQNDSESIPANKYQVMVAQHVHCDDNDILNYIYLSMFLLLAGF
jgi:hypothetical protein